MYEKIDECGGPQQVEHRNIFLPLAPLQERGVTALCMHVQRNGDDTKKLKKAVPLKSVTSYYTVDVAALFTAVLWANTVTVLTCNTIYSDKQIPHR